MFRSEHRGVLVKTPRRFFKNSTTCCFKPHNEGRKAKGGGRFDCDFIKLFSSLSIEQSGYRKHL